MRRQVGDKCKIVRPKAPRVGDKCSVEDKCGRLSVGDSWRLMQPKEPRVGDKCGRRVQTHAAQGNQGGRQVWETSVGDKRGRHSCGPRHPEWETSVR